MDKSFSTSHSTWTRKDTIAAVGCFVELVVGGFRSTTILHHYQSEGGWFAVEEDISSMVVRKIRQYEGGACVYFVFKREIISL